MRNFRAGAQRFGCMLVLCSALHACSEEGNGLFGAASPAADTPSAPQSVQTVERDVEDPSVFFADEAGLWDGRPSLGGVWVAHPDVTDPERVIIRNPGNGQFVVGALFRRERDIPGPRLQISSDAATALGMLAGAPAQLSVVALRRESVPLAPKTPAQALDADDNATSEPSDPLAAASAALDDLDAADSPSPTESRLAKPFLQVGIFSVEANATRTAQQMTAAGMTAQIRRSETNGRSFWRVIVGPAGTTAERDRLLQNIKREGFTDAYPVSG